MVEQPNNSFHLWQGWDHHDAKDYEINIIMTWMTVNMGTSPVFLIPSVDQLSLRTQGCKESIAHLALPGFLIFYFYLFSPRTPLLRLFTFPPHLFLVHPSTFSTVAAVCGRNCNNLNSGQSCWQFIRFVWQQQQVSQHLGKFKYVLKQMIRWASLWGNRNIWNRLKWKKSESVKVTSKRCLSLWCHLRLASFVPMCLLWFIVNASAQYFVSLLCLLRLHPFISPSYPLPLHSRFALSPSHLTKPPLYYRCCLIWRDSPCPSAELLIGPNWVIFCCALLHSVFCVQQTLF